MGRMHLSGKRRQDVRDDYNHHNSGHVAVWVMAPPTVQQTLIRSKPKAFFCPPYMGVKGWVGVRLDRQTDWDELAAILHDGYLMAGPSKMRRRNAPHPQKSAPNQQTVNSARARKPASKLGVHRYD
jgi:hypothetical protein